MTINLNVIALKIVLTEKYFVNISVKTLVVQGVIRAVDVMLANLTMQYMYHFINLPMKLNEKIEKML